MHTKVRSAIAAAVIAVLLPGIALASQITFPAPTGWVNDFAGVLSPGAATPAEQVEAANQLESAIGRLLMIVENYPNLKANRTFQSLMDELADTEARIVVARMRFNDLVRDYNTSIRRFPTVLLARMFGFDMRDYLKAPDEAHQAPDIGF